MTTNAKKGGEVNPTGCDDIPGWDIHNCCSSCHEDHDEYGVPMIFMEYRGELIEVCCACTPVAFREASRLSLPLAGSPTKKGEK